MLQNYYYDAKDTCRTEGTNYIDESLLIKIQFFFKECLNNATKPETMGNIWQVAPSPQVNKTFTKIILQAVKGH